MEEVFTKKATEGQRLAAVCLTQGSAGTLGCADYLRERFPRITVAAGEALQCPTLLYTGHGEHRIEGIGDKHVPWIHNLRNTDVVAGIDDDACMALHPTVQRAGRARHTWRGEGSIRSCSTGLISSVFRPSPTS